MFYLVVINFFPLGDPSFEQQEKVCNLKLMRSQKVTRTICSFDSLINQLAVINFLASFLSPLIIVGGGGRCRLYSSASRENDDRIKEFVERLVCSSDAFRHLFIFVSHTLTRGVSCSRLTARNCFYLSSGNTYRNRVFAELYSPNDFSRCR